MKIAIIGRGAIGTLYGQLFEKGHQDVVFLVDADRKKRYEAKIDCVAALMDAYVAYKNNRDMFD